MAINKHGGERAGAGRKAIDPLDKKVTVNIFIKQRHINKYRGLPALKKKIVSKIEEGSL